jgi:hypothetical protein
MPAQLPKGSAVFVDTNILLYLLYTLERYLGDKDLLALGSFQGVQVVTARQYLEYF